MPLRGTAPRAERPVGPSAGSKGSYFGTSRMTDMPLNERRRVFVVGETHRSWNEIPPLHMHSSRRASDPEHPPPQEKEGEVASHTARRPQYTSRLRRLHRQGSAAAPFCARAFPRRTVHTPRSLEPSQRHKSRPLFGPTAVRTLTLRWDAGCPNRSYRTRTVVLPSVPTSAPSSPCLRACHDRVCGAPTVDADRSPFAPLCLALARGQATHASTGASPEHRTHRCS